MTTLTKTLSISAMTIALASGMGLAHAQSQGATGDPLINPDPNATLSTPTASGMSTTPAERGEAADSNTTYGHSRDSSNLNNNGAATSDNMNSAPATAGEAARSNNSYGNTRDFNSLNNSSTGTANDGMNTPPASDLDAAPIERSPRAGRN